MKSTSSSPPSTPLSPTTAMRPPHSGRWPRTARLVWRERIDVDEKGESIFVWDEVWTRPSRKFGRSKEGRLRQVAQIPSLAPHFPRLLKANGQNGVLTLARPNFERKASLADLDLATVRRLRAELRAIYSAMYDNSIAYVFSPDGFDVVSTRASSGWRIWIDGWNHASRHKVRETGSKKTAYFVEMEAEQLQKIDEYFSPFESRAKQKISAIINHDPI
ncbi:hypothetical protein RB595_009450 [Gaeumannomyces hyphopodioides]